MEKLTLFILAIVMIFVYIASHFYLYKRLLNLSRIFIPSLHSAFLMVLITFLGVSIILSFMNVPAPFNGVIKAISAYWMGIYIYLLLLFILFDAFYFIIKRFARSNETSLAAIHQYGLVTAFLIAIVVIVYGFVNATNVSTKSYAVQTDDTTTAVNMKIALISDLHIGAIHSESRFAKTVAEINAANADLVVISGDIFNDNYNAIEDPEKVAQLFRSIQSTYGVYASLGNHDGGKTVSDMLALLQRGNVMVLHDDYTIIDNKLALFGRLDPSPIGGYGNMSRKPVDHLIAQIDPSMPIVVLDHTPNNLDDYDEKVDLVLSGHTHKGQLFPGNFITNLVFEVDYGQYRRDHNSPHVIVSSGAGVWGMPMRVGSKNEVVLIDLK